MNKVGKRIWFLKNTGEVIFIRGEGIGGEGSTPEEDVEYYQELNERVRSTIDYIDLEYGQYAEDFMLCNSYRVNPETKQLEFSYPDPNATEPQESVYQKPLSEQVKELEERQVIMQQALDELLLGGM